MSSAEEVATAEKVATIVVFSCQDLSQVTILIAVSCCVGGPPRVAAHIFDETYPQLQAACFVANEIIK